MNEPPPAPLEETLDPDDWDALRALGHRMVDDMLDYLRTVRERPVWQPIPAADKQALSRPLPSAPQGAARAYDDFVRHVLPNPQGNLHPRFWGWVIGTGTASGMLAEMLAAGMNPNLGGAEHGANYVEAQVIEWCKQMLDFAPDASGLLVSGGSMANLTGLAVARTARAGFDVRERGVGAGSAPLTLYGSSEMHNSIQKSVELLGLGDAALRRIAVDADYRIDIAALRAAIARDRAAGCRPVCLIGNAGTVNTGAFDDLRQLADVAAAEDMWLHVDGAFGALAALTPGARQLTDGMQRADSLAFDLHKWMYMPIEVGCVLIRDRAMHHATFAIHAGYLAHDGERGLAAGPHWFGEYGVQLSRGFRALKVWLSLKEHGIDKYARLIQQNIDQARYLAERVDAAPDLERLAPAPLNIVCFRYRPPGAADSGLDALNEELLTRLYESGLAAPSYARLNGRYALRVAITNHRSRRTDFDLLVREVTRLGHEIAASA